MTEAESFDLYLRETAKRRKLAISTFLVCVGLLLYFVMHRSPLGNTFPKVAYQPNYWYMSAKVEQGYVMYAYPTRTVCERMRAKLAQDFLHDDVSLTPCTLGEHVANPRQSYTSPSGEAVRRQLTGDT